MWERPACGAVGVERSVAGRVPVRSVDVSGVLEGSRGDVLLRRVSLPDLDVPRRSRRRGAGRVAIVVVVVVVVGGGGGWNGSLGGARVRECCWYHSDG